MEAGEALDPFAKVRSGAPLTALRETAAPTPLTLASAYATVAANGVYAAPYTVTKITRDGRTVYTARPDTRRALDETDASVVNASMYNWSAFGGPGASIAPNSAPTFFTAGAGGGTTRRTVWSTGLDSRLALTVVLFADRPGEKKNTTVPAQLPNKPAPTETAEDTAARIWRLAMAGAGESSPPTPVAEAGQARDGSGPDQG